MILEHYVSEEGDSVLQLQELPRIQNNLYAFRTSEYGKPADHRAREEVGILRFMNAIAVAAHPNVSPKLNTRRRASKNPFPRRAWERGCLVTRLLVWLLVFFLVPTLCVGTYSSTLC